MGKSWLVCVLLGSMAWAQAAPGAPAPAPADTSASVSSDTPVLTIIGVCTPHKTATTAATTATGAEKTPLAETPASDCKTVYTKAEFEKLANAVAPNVTPQLRKQLASMLPGLLAMSDEAKKRGIDKTPRFEETVAFAKMRILQTELQKEMQEESAKVPAEDIAAYYKNNPEAFEVYNLDRLFVPRSKSEDAKPEDDKADEKLSEEAQKAKQAEEKAKTDASELAMSKLAETLRARAVAGDEFAKLQKEAFNAAGMKIESPTVTLPKVRRTGLPAAHVAIFELKEGEVSQVITDTGGHYVYKVNSKEAPPLDQVKEEIRNLLQNQRMRDMTEKINGSFKVETNEAYFGPSGPGSMAPPRRMPSPHMAPGPLTPQAKPSTPPPAQPPAANPN
jgi:PPIC-type PPIASE domain